MALRTLSKEALTGQLKGEAKSLGFVACGVAQARALTEPGEHLRTWLKKRYHADMRWMEENFAKRIDPRQYIPDAQSVIMVALNYYQALPDQSPDEARIARYALGRDYHDVVKKKLKLLQAWLQSKTPAAKVITFVDTAAVMEKAWAEIAGIGWIGKNGLLLTRTHGSFVVLGGLLTNQVLAYDQPHPNHCGSCTRCMQSCPTKAIVQPKVVNANKCLSYWTIESRKPQLPKAVRKKLEGRVFGCDRCQEVCPWNQKFAVPTTVPEFLDRPQNKNPKRVELSLLTPESFQTRFTKSAVKRTKYNGFMRNVRALTED